MIEDPGGMTRGTLLRHVAVAFRLAPEEAAEKMSGSGVPL